MQVPIALREATSTDHVALGEVMYDAVRNGPSRYTEAQRQAWVPEPRSGPDWDSRLASQVVVLATVGGRIVGFMSLEPPDYVDFAYIRPEWQGRGVFRQLFGEIECVAQVAGQGLLRTHASLMARPAFEAVGFRVVEPEQVEIRGETLDRFAMEKALGLVGGTG